MYHDIQILWNLSALSKNWAITLSTFKLAIIVDCRIPNMWSCNNALCILCLHSVLTKVYVEKQVSQYIEERNQINQFNCNFPSANGQHNVSACDGVVWMWSDMTLFIIPFTSCEQNYKTCFLNDNFLKKSQSISKKHHPTPLFLSKRAKIAANDR